MDPLRDALGSKMTPQIGHAAPKGMKKPNRADYSERTCFQNPFWHACGHPVAPKWSILDPPWRQNCGFWCIASRTFLPTPVQANRKNNQKPAETCRTLAENLPTTSKKLAENLQRTSKKLARKAKTLQRTSKAPAKPISKSQTAYCMLRRDSTRNKRRTTK